MFKLRVAERLMRHRRAPNYKQHVSACRIDHLGCEEKRYRWVLGETKSGTHCPDCESCAGKVKSISEWKAMGKLPCKCKLEPATGIMKWLVCKLALRIL